MDKLKKIFRKKNPESSQEEGPTIPRRELITGAAALFLTACSSPRKQQIGGDQIRDPRQPDVPESGSRGDFEQLESRALEITESSPSTMLRQLLEVTPSEYQDTLVTESGDYTLPASAIGVEVYVDENDQDIITMKIEDTTEVDHSRRNKIHLDLALQGVSVADLDFGSIAEALENGSIKITAVEVSSPESVTIAEIDENGKIERVGYYDVWGNQGSDEGLVADYSDPDNPIYIDSDRAYSAYAQMATMLSRYEEGSIPYMVAEYYRDRDIEV